MYNNRLLGTITVLVVLAGVLVGVGQISTTRVEAAPLCNLFTVNTASLTASEIYYSRLAAERFMDPQLCSTQKSIPLTAPDLFGSEAYYAREAALGQESASFPTTGGSGDLTPATDGVLDPTRGY